SKFAIPDAVGGTPKTLLPPRARFNQAVENRNDFIVVHMTCHLLLIKWQLPYHSLGVLVDHCTVKHLSQLQTRSSTGPGEQLPASAPSVRQTTCKQIQKGGNT